MTRRAFTWIWVFLMFLCMLFLPVYHLDSKFHLTLRRIYLDLLPGVLFGSGDVLDYPVFLFEVVLFVVSGKIIFDRKQ